ncbi:MCM binding protein homolog Mcb1 [Schizosaccharomyces pombe]|uniref:UPF0616 protein C1687.04 n=1 Tax=Schizosaccharomyces pombe (strain 972 / ATCC 24843) TaxID=284812 RepID=YFF4_SCHPO|nr:mini-chromosome maintenance complex-binding protein mcb1 [Schizosaccharomyces pombe]O94450.1 RecName: Full=UPF0616 protein C1687.04 [Schizosaccharomyces pombe 972h-]CAA22598.1 MCM binding protein homolog Mcb1 (predicted) [Schizosaccharomyces pombe]|eukprot:NP_593122.1 mini-chromosome maintenance complex-binding protein mcb1 [Schizosaccharomyces pombe]
MVIALSDSFIENPRSFLQRFQDALFAGSKPDLQGTLGIDEEVSNIFATEERIRKIPNYLDCKWSELKTGQLLRLQGMVQDTNFGHEFFAGAVEVNENIWRGCRYILDFSEDEMHLDESKIVLDERYSLFLTNVPGERTLPVIEALGNWGSESLKERSLKYSNRLQASNDTGVCVKCYGGMETKVQVCQAIDVIGIYEEPSEYSDGLPILHMLCFKDYTQSATQAPSPQQAEIIRPKILKYFEKVLGENIAAESLMLALLSNVVHKTTGLVIGGFTLNLTNCTSELVSQLVSVLRPLIKRMVIQKVNVAELNRKPLYPLSDGETLDTSHLQVAPGTLIVLDETELSSGTLNDVGCRNVQFLSSLISQQDLTFFYPFSSFTVHSNVRIIILSHGRSILPADVGCRCRGDSPDTIEFPTDSDELQEFCNFFHMWNMRANIPENMLDYIQSTYVSSRQYNKEINEKTLSLQINCSRLYAKSFGRQLVSRIDFEAARSLINHWTVN